MPLPHAWWIARKVVLAPKYFDVALSCPENSAQKIWAQYQFASTFCTGPKKKQDGIKMKKKARWITCPFAYLENESLHFS